MNNLQPAWFGFNSIKNPEETSSRGHKFQPCVFGELKRLSIPMTTEGLYKLVCMTILPAGNALAIASAVFEQQDLPVAPANSRHLFERGDGIGKRTRRERGEYGVKTLVRKRQCLRVCQREGNMYGQLFCSVSGNV
jgi:hypothetical protein